MRVLSLFSGIAGLDLGIKLALPEARVVAYCEADTYCQRIIRARIADGRLDDAPIFDDVQTFNGLEWASKADMVSGGFPCTDISNAGKRVGIEGERSGLWQEMARIIGEVRPGYVFVENVGPLVVRGLDRVLADLASLGFDAEWGCVRASDVGAPHRRERIFILARRQLADAGHFSGRRDASEGDERQARFESAPCLGDVAVSNRGRRELLGGGELSQDRDTQPRHDADGRGGEGSVLAHPSCTGLEERPSERNHPEWGGGDR